MLYYPALTPIDTLVSHTPTAVPWLLFLLLCFIRCVFFLFHLLPLSPVFSVVLSILKKLWLCPPSKWDYFCSFASEKQLWSGGQMRDEFSRTPSLFEVNLFLCCLSSGAIEHRDAPNTAVKHFTQADVNNGKIIYRPPQAPSHLQELYQYSFTGEMHTLTSQVRI